MKYKTLFITLSFTIAQSAFAFNAEEKPEACPSVKAIQAESVNHVVRESSRGGLIALGSDNHYGTKEVWKFGIMLYGDYDNEQAFLEVSKKAVKALKPYVYGPEKANDGHWFCMYSADGAIGQAITPPDEPTLTQVISRFYRVQNIKV